jgi:hypothetical protein
VAVALDEADAAVLAAAGVQADLAVTFTPAAQARLEAAGIPVVPSHALHGPLAHARTALRLARLVARADAAFRASGAMTGAEAEALRIHVFYHGAALLFLHACLKRFRAADAFLLAEGGRAEAVAGFEPCFLRLAARAAPFLGDFNHTGYSTLHARLARACNRVLARLPGDRPVLLHLDLANPVPHRIAAMLAAAEPRLALVQVRGPGRDMAATLRRTGRALLGAATAALTGRVPRRLVLFRAAPRPLSDCAMPPAALAFDAGNPLIGLALAPTLADYARLVRFEAEAGLVLARAVAPATVRGGAVMLDNLIFPATLAATDALHGRGMAVAMVNHGTHTAQAAPLGDRVARLWAGQGRLVHPALDVLIAKGPATAALARAMAGDRPPAVVALPLFDAAAPRPAADGTFRILHAGNCLDTAQHLPVAAETPDEYRAGLERLAAELAGLDGILLTLKLKLGKAGLAPETLKGWLAARGLDRFATVDTDTPLAALLPATDLVVSNTSTVIEEALAHRIPVLLESWRRQYRHLPARLDPPAPGARAAVYALRPGAAVAAMVAAIAAHHGRDRLTEAEIAGLSWRPGEITPPAALAHLLFGPRPNR